VSPACIALLFASLSQQLETSPPEAARGIAAVHLNHVSWVSDANTYEAVKRSDFMTRAFAPWEERPPVQQDTPSRALCFYGQNTYVELIQPDADHEVGSAVIAFGVESEGGIETLAAALEARGIGTTERTVTRELDGEPVPWFELLELERAYPGSKLCVVALEYRPDFLAAWHPDRPPAGGGIERQRVLERYVAGVDSQELARTGLLLDLTEVDLLLDEREEAWFLTVCRAFGYAIERSPIPGLLCAEPWEPTEAWFCEGPGVRFMLTRRPRARSPLQDVWVKLSRPAPTAGVELERMLVLCHDGDPQATLKFR